MATYYVAPSGGSNANSGLSTGAAWATLAYALSNLAAGDTLVVMTGTHNLSSSITTIDSGTAGNFITVQPQVAGQSIINLTADSAILFGTSVSYLRFRDLVFDGIAPSTTNALLRWNACNYIEFIDCEVRNSNSYLIRFYGGSTNCLVDGCILHHEDFANYGKDCVLIDGTGTTATVRNCTMYHSPHSGVYVDAGATATVHDNIIYDLASHCINCVDATLTAYDNRLSGAGAWNRSDLVDWKHGHFIKGAATATVRHETIFDCVGAAVGFKDFTGTADIHNITSNNNNTAGYNSGDCIYLNNTSTTSPTALEVANCIFYLTAGGQRVHYLTRNGGSAPSTITFSNNHYYDSGSAQVDSHWFGTSYTALSDWRTARETNAVITGDPLFYNLASDDYRLAAGSPDINAGTDLGYAYYGAAPDRGAHEREPVSLAFASVPATGQTATVMSTFTVVAAFFDGATDTAWSTNVVVALASGPGSISGTTTRTPSSGVATFNDIQFSAAGTVTMSATSGSLSGTATAITITDSTPPGVITVAVAGVPPQLRQLREVRGRIGIL